MSFIAATTGQLFVMVLIEPVASSKRSRMQSTSVDRLHGVRRLSCGFKIATAGGATQIRTATIHIRLKIESINASLMDVVLVAAGAMLLLATGNCRGQFDHATS